MKSIKDQGLRRILMVANTFGVQELLLNEKLEIEAIQIGTISLPIRNHEMYWTSQTGKTLHVTELHERHIGNIINKIRRREYKGTFFAIGISDWLAIFHIELILRELRYYMREEKVQRCNELSFTMSLIHHSIICCNKSIKDMVNHRENLKDNYALLAGEYKQLRSQIDQ